MSRRTERVPVVAVTGHLGAGKTSLLNHLLRAPGARLGVVVNDFGALNVDAALVAGQVDDAVAISGGCLCCLPDTGGLDDALAKLSQPRLRLDAIIIEASGLADPLALARLVRFSEVGRIRPGGVIEMIDAVEHFRTVDTSTTVPLRYAAATLVVVGKVDLLPPEQREATVARIRARVRERNPHAPLVTATQGRIDPALVFDVAAGQVAGHAVGEQDELPLDVLVDHDHHDHGIHAAAASVRLSGPVAPDALVDLVEDPPTGAYRMKGRVRVRTPQGERGYVINVVGATIHVAPLSPPPPAGELVAIGIDLDESSALQRLQAVADAPAEQVDPVGLRRLQRHVRLSAASRTR